MNTRTGFFYRLRSRLFGETDPVEQQLEEISRQGAGMARIAHLCAFALILLFSLGSLVALGGDALSSITLEWNRGQVDIPSAISLAVTTLLVACMDVGMVYAASMLRRLAARRADPSEKRLHETVMFIVALLEASTYLYMSARYEHPVNLVVWALISARAAAAPLLSVYLAMARTIPVSSRDILYQGELISGKGVLRHVTRLANNPDARLAELLVMFYAVADISESDQKRLDTFITVAQRGGLLSNPADTFSSPEPTPGGPTGPGTPVVISEDPAPREDQGKVVALERNPERSVVVRRRPAAEGESAPSSTRPYRTYDSPEMEEIVGFALLDRAGWDHENDRPAMSKAEFRRKLSVRGARANELYTRWELEHRPPYARPDLEQDFAQ